MDACFAFVVLVSIFQY